MGCVCLCPCCQVGRRVGVGPVQRVRTGVAVCVPYSAAVCSAHRCARQCLRQAEGAAQREPAVRD